MNCLVFSKERLSDDSLGFLGGGLCENSEGIEFGFKIAFTLEPSVTLVTIGREMLFCTQP